MGMPNEQCCNNSENSKNCAFAKKQKRFAPLLFFPLSNRGRRGGKSLNLFYLNLCTEEVGEVLILAQFWDILGHFGSR